MTCTYCTHTHVHARSFLENKREGLYSKILTVIVLADNIRGDFSYFFRIFTNVHLLVLWLRKKTVMKVKLYNG